MLVVRKRRSQYGLVSFVINGDPRYSPPGAAGPFWCTWSSTQVIVKLLNGMLIFMMEVVFGILGMAIAVKNSDIGTLQISCTTRRCEAEA